MNISVEKRELTGKKARRLLTQGLTPVVIYNAKTESSNGKVASGDILRLINSSTSASIVDIEIDGRSLKALIKDVDRDPRTDIIRHVAFFEIDPEANMSFNIPFTFNGVAPAVKNNLGVLVQSATSIEVRGKLAAAVEAIEVSISELENPGDSILVGDIELPEGLVLIREEQKNQAVISVSQLQKLVEATTEEGEEGTEGEEGEDGAEGEASEEAAS